MRFEYYPDTDTLYIELREGPGADAHEVAPDMVLDLDEAGQVIGIALEHASTKTDLNTVSLAALPLKATPPQAA